MQSLITGFSKQKKLAKTVEIQEHTETFGYVHVSILVEMNNKKTRTVNHECNHPYVILSSLGKQIKPQDIKNLTLAHGEIMSLAC